MLGVVRVMRAFAPLIAVSAAPVVVDVGSGLGSLAVTSDPDRIEFGVPGLAYTSARSALNMLTNQWA